MITKLENIIAPAIEKMGYDLVRLRLLGEKSKRLEVMIDRKDLNNITINDCMNVSDHISVLLDVEDPISSAYSLEVTSPGLNRPLIKYSDYERFCGQSIKLKLITAVEDLKVLRGNLKKCNRKANNG